MSEVKYESIVFLQGDDYAEAEQIADEATARVVGKDDAYWPGLYRGCTEWTKALFEHMWQWSSGDPSEQYDGPGEPWGSGDEIQRFDSAGRRTWRNLTSGYVMSWNIGLSYAGLHRVVKVES